jgi:hypothetical protein
MEDKRIKMPLASQAEREKSMASQSSSGNSSDNLNPPPPKKSIVGTSNTMPPTHEDKEQLVLERSEATLKVEEEGEEDDTFEKDS